MAGCESGAILSCNRKAKNPADRVAAAFYGHHGPVYGLQRHPFAAKYFLSVGDWTVRIWADDSKQPLVTTRYHSTYLTGAPLRASVACFWLHR
jgi:dynein intermediate chain 2, axonemal